MALAPGWTLHAGGPHIALPLLKGFLEHHGVEARLYDLNNESTRYLGVHVTEAAAQKACSTPTRQSMNALYFGAEDRLQEVARPFGGTWYAQEGYRHKQCVLSSPDSVRKYSRDVSPFTRYFEEEAVPRMLEQNPRIIGLTLVVPSQILPTFELVRLLRKAGYDDTIVLGGNIVTRIFDDMALDWVFDLIDGAVKLQGEQVMLDIYKALEKGTGFSDVPNLMWRKEDGTIAVNKQKLLEPADFVQPDFDGMPVHDYWGTNYLTMIAARGCYYNRCSFCAIPFGYGERGYIGMAPAVRVLESMKSSAQQYGISRFKFVDESFHPKLMADLVRLILRDNFKCTFEGYFRLEETWMNRDFLSLCYKAGLRKMYLGLELVPGETRSLLDKKDGANPLEFLKAIHDIGIKAHVFSMFGYPGTGVREAFDTIDFTLKNHSLIDTLDVFPFYYARHTKVEGVEILRDHGMTWNVEHRYRALDASSLPTEQVHVLAKKLSDVIWREHPQWLHPIYRMVSPWHPSQVKPAPVPGMNLEF
ncbi:MAG: B12-binding domain-containing radical SAM protein [Alphaproteobacteria bacterium]